MATKIPDNGDPDFQKSAEQQSADNEAENRSISGSYGTDKEMLALLGKPGAKPWIPNIGDAVTGTVIDIQQAESEYGTYPLIELDCGNRTVAVHCYHSTLSRDIERRNVKPGDKLGIAYLGEKESKVKGHNPFHQYRVIHRSQ